jgi:hypothetical protein
MKTQLWLGLLMLISMDTGRALADPVAPDAANLNAAFKFTPDQYQAALDEGKRAAQKGKKPEEVLKRCRQELIWVRAGGRDGKSSSMVWCLPLQQASVVAAAYQAEKLYESPSLPAWLATEGHYRHIAFRVMLLSRPKIGQDPWRAFAAGLSHTVAPNEVRRPASEAEVNAVKFLLTDDRGHRLEAASTASTEQSAGTVTYGGVDVQTHSMTAGTAGTLNATTVGPGGSTFTNGSYNAQSTFTRTDYMPWSAQTPYYQAWYTVVFPLFDDQGKPTIGADVKTVTLHAITEAGELDAVYNLSRSGAP